MKTLVFAFVAVSAFAQKSNPLTDQVMARYNNIKQSLLDSAEVMPEEFYTYRLTAGQRQYGEWIAHAAMGNYGYCSVIRGEKTPDTHAMHDLKTKAALSKALLESFQYCDGALEGMNDAKAMTAVTVNGRTVYPVTGMVNLVASQNEHYGNIVGYLRSRNIVPPSTARAQKQKK